jgi:uncharacterized coiled-coil DUF342 family protein
VAEQQKINEISAINQQLAALKEQANKANAETKTHAEKRDQLNEQFRKIRQEIYELTNERNRLNETVKTLKQQRDEARTKIRANIEEIKTRRQKLMELKKKTPQQSHQELQKEFTDIEWKIQTTSLDLQEEKELIENVKQLETQLHVYKKIEQHNQKITELQKELDTLKTKANAFHQELSATAQKSQETHANILTKISESKKIKSEADSLHKAYLQAKEKVKPLHDEITKLIEQKAKLQSTVHEEDERKRKTAEHTLKEKLGVQAREKLQRGEKLSWNEFQLLSEDDDQTQD